MSLPPCIVDVMWTRSGGPRRRLWLPVVLLWPLLALLGLLALMVALLLDVLLRASGRSRWRWTALVAAGLMAIAEARGLRVSVKGESATVDVVVK